MTVSELVVKVNADTRDAESGLSALGGKLGSIGGGIATAFGGLAVAGIAAVGGALAASVTAAAGFDQTMASIRSKLSPSEWDAQGAAIQETALRLGRDYPLSASEAGKAIDLLLQKGVSAKNINEGWADSVVKLSTATGSDLVTSAEIAAAASDAFNISAEQSGAVVNKITGTVLKGGMSITDYGLAMKAAGGVVALAGGTIDDMNLGLATMARRGIEGSDAGTSLKTMYMNLIPTTKGQIAVAKELGLVTADGSSKFFDAEGKVKSYAEISTILAKATSGLTQEQKLMALETLFGSDAIRAAGIAAEYGKGEIHELSAAINSVDAGEVAKERMNNLKSSVENLGGSLETAGVKIGMKFTPGLKSIVDGATEVVNNATPMLEGFAERASSAIGEASTQIADSWRTAKDAFAGKWLPSDQIPPFVNGVGIVATKLGELRDGLQKVADRAGEMGAWDNFKSGFDTLAVEVQGVGDRFGELSKALERLNTAAGGAQGNVNILAGAVKIVGVAFELWSLSIAQAIDATMTFASNSVNLISVLANVGKAWAALATGDLPAYEEATKAGAGAVLDMMTTHEGFIGRTVERTQQGYRAIAGAAETEMPAVAAATEAGMAGAVAAVESNAPAAVAGAEAMGTGMAAGIEAAAPAMAAAAEAGATGAVAAVDGQTAAASAAGTAMGTGMAGGIEAAAPAMIAAADAGASGAVSAVQGQEGAASSAGQSLGQALGSGLEGGIMGYVGRVAAAARAMVSAALTAGNVEADARSPSKKTEKLGKDMAQGLEIGLNSSNLGAEMQRKIRDFIEASRAYIPVAGQIKRVEDEIKAIRDKGQVDALFRAKEMITIDSEALRLKEAQVRLERDLLPLRQDLARASREVADIERGSLGDRTALIEMDGQRKVLRLQTLDLEKQLIGLDRDSKRAQGIQTQIDKLTAQDRLLGIEAERIRLTNEIASTGSKVRREALDDQARGQETVIGLIKDEIDTLGAESAVFQANENIIKNATQNEIDYRNRLIAVFTAEGKPLADRITAGLALVAQLEKEGKISKELADRLRDVAKEAGVSTSETKSLGNAAATATPQLDAAAKKAAEMAAGAQAIAEQAKAAASKVDALSSSLGKLPEWFRPNVDPIFRPRANGGPVGAGLPYLVGERGREMFVPTQSGTIMPADQTRAMLSGDSFAAGGTQTVRVDVAIGGRVAEQIYVEGRDLAIRRGRDS